MVFSLLYEIESIHLLLPSKFKYFTFNANSELELKDGHFLNGTQFTPNLSHNGLCFLKVGSMDLKYNENKLILTEDDSIGSHVILEPVGDGDKISFYLKLIGEYLGECLELVKGKESAVKVQALWTDNSRKAQNLPKQIPEAVTDNSNAILSLEGFQIHTDASQNFRILLNGNSYHYATEFENQFHFGRDNYTAGAKFQLIKVNNSDKLSLYNPELGYLGRGKNEYDSDCVKYYKEIPKDVVYLEPIEEKHGVYRLKCENSSNSEDGEEFVWVDFIKANCGFTDFTKEFKRAAVVQFILDY
jgi:hypothetical protein